MTTQCFSINQERRTEFGYLSFWTLDLLLRLGNEDKKYFQPFAFILHLLVKSPSSIFIVCIQKHFQSIILHMGTANYFLSNSFIISQLLFHLKQVKNTYLVTDQLSAIEFQGHRINLLIQNNPDAIKHRDMINNFISVSYNMTEHSLLGRKYYELITLNGVYYDRSILQWSLEILKEISTHVAVKEYLEYIIFSTI